MTTKIVIPFRVLGILVFFLLIITLVFKDTFSVQFFSQVAKTWNGIKKLSGIFPYFSNRNGNKNINLKKNKYFSYPLIIEKI